MVEALTSSLRLLPDRGAAKEYQLVSVLPPIPLPPEPHCLVSVANLGGEFRKEGVSSRILHCLMLGCPGAGWCGRVLDGWGILGVYWTWWGVCDLGWGILGVILCGWESLGLGV